MNAFKEKLHHFVSENEWLKKEIDQRQEFLTKINVRMLLVAFALNRYCISVSLPLIAICFLVVMFPQDSTAAVQAQIGEFSGMRHTLQSKMAATQVPDILVYVNQKAHMFELQKELKVRFAYVFVFVCFWLLGVRWQ